jgi:hypothetical protein
MIISNQTPEIIYIALPHLNTVTQAAWKSQNWTKATIYFKMEGLQYNRIDHWEEQGRKEQYYFVLKQWSYVDLEITNI